MTDEEKVELQNMVTMAAKGIEDRLIATFGKIIEGINEKVNLSAKASAELEAKAKTAFESLPIVIKTQIENQLGDLTKQFEERQKELGGNSGGNAGGFGLRDLLGQSDKIIGLINAWKQPTPEQVMTAKLSEIYQWHGLLSKLERGGASGEDLTKQIASTFTTKKQE